MRIGIIVPHMFMHRDILPKVIFSPGKCAIELAEGLQELGAEVSLFSPGHVDTTVNNITSDLSLFEAELARRGDSYVDLLKKHPVTFITLARQVQAELVAKAYGMANRGEFDVLHVYTNEEELGLVFAGLCQKPVVFTHHDPYNFLVRYKSIFPKYAHLPFISMSYAQRKAMPANTNWLANIYHGLNPATLTPIYKPSDDYVAFLGRIIEPKGLHLAIKAVKLFNQQNNANLKLRIAGKHYSGHIKDTYWQETILPQIDDEHIIYEGFLDSLETKNEFLGNAQALLITSLFEEPFGMVSIEALACGTPVIGLSSGAIPEIINNPKIGSVAKKIFDETGKLNEVATAENIASCFKNINNYDRQTCRRVFKESYTTQRVAHEHLAAYAKLTK